MGTKSFSFTLKKVIWVLIAISFLVSCTQSPKKNDKPKAPKVVEEIEQPTEEPTEVEPEEPAIEVPEIKPPPKVGLIFGAAGLKSFAYIGILQELEQARIPIDFVIGFEWGALVAALYASQARVSHVEWQMSKMTEADFRDKSIFGRSFKPQSIKLFDGFLEKAFSRQSLLQLQIPFTCPIVRDRSLFWLQAVRVKDALKRCMLHPPLFAGRKEYAAGFALEEAVEKMKSQGIDVVYFINAIEGGPIIEASEKKDLFADAILWEQMRKSYRDYEKAGVEKIGIYLPSGGIRNITKKRDYMKAGRKAGRSLVNKLRENYQF